MALATKKLQQTVNLASQSADLLPLAGVGGYTNEPALTLCNDTLQEALCQPNAYKWNRAFMPPFMTSLNKQDYIVTGAVAFLLGSQSFGVGIALKTANTPGIVLSSNVVTVNCVEPHNLTSAAIGQTVYMLGNVDSQFNSTFTNNGTIAQYSGGWVITSVPSTTSFTFALVASDTTSGAPGITDFGWLETASITELNNTSPVPNTYQVKAVSYLTPSRAAFAIPGKVCVLVDNGDGTLKVRFREMPGSTVWTANLVYQKKAPLKTALTDTWSPIPDEYGYLYTQGFLSRAYRFINSPRSEAEDMKFQRAIQKAMTQGDEEATDQSVVPESSLLDGTSTFQYW